MKIANHDVSKKVFIIAEVGNNHEGSFDNAVKLVHAAAESGADAVKFQTFQARLFSSNKDEARFKRLQGFELTYPEFKKLEELARSLGLLFMSTPLDMESAKFLAPIVDCFKIASGDNNFYPLIDEVCKAKKPLIVSTGMSDLAQIQKTVAFVEERISKDNLALLHCVSAYPAPEDDQLNLASIQFIAEKTGCITGYSDHTAGTRACLIATALGARILEKHFTLDKNFSEFRDHQLSADPKEMKFLVDEVRLMEKIIGTKSKELQECEKGVAAAARRSIVAGKELARGHRIEMSDLLWIRPPGGLEPGNESKLIGKTLKRDLPFGEMIQLSDIE